MSRTTRANARRRISLLATTSFVATSVLSGAGVLTATLTPSIALAASECGPIPVGGIVACNPPSSPTYDDGIDYAGVAQDVTLEIVNIQVKTTTNGNEGINLTSAGADNLSVQFFDLGLPGGPSSVDATVPAVDGIGINVKSGGGDVTVSTVDLDGGFNPADVANTIIGSDGIIVATGGAGDATITVGADTVTSTVGYALQASAFGSGDATITTAAGSTITAPSTWIAIGTQSLGGGDAAITIGGSVTGGDVGGFGTVAASASGGGSTSVTILGTGSVTGQGGLASVHAWTQNGSADATVDVQAGATVTNTSTGAAILAKASGGDAVVTTAAGSLITTNFAATGDGIDATSATGGVSITANGDIGTSAPLGFVGGEGINATVTGGTKNIDIKLGGDIFSGLTGVTATNGGTGDVLVTTLKGGDITSVSGDGVDAHANGGGDVAINLLGGAITSNTANLGAGHAIDASATGAGSVTINSQDTLTNLGGDAVLSTTVNGQNYVGVSAKVTTVGGHGINASSSGSGDVVVSGYGVDGFLLGNGTNPGVADDGVGAEIDATGGDAIHATASGSGNIIVITSGDQSGAAGPGNLTGGFLNGNADNGVFAQNTGTGGVQVTLNADAGSSGNFLGVWGVDASIANAANASNVSVSSDANIYSDGGGIRSTTNGTGNATTNFAVGATKNIELVTNGAVGISTTQTGATGDATTVVGNAGFTTRVAAQETGIETTVAGTGTASTTLGDNVTIDPDDFGIKDTSAAGRAVVTTGSGDTITVDDSIILPNPFGTSGDALNVGILVSSGAVADPGGLTSAEVSVGANNTISVLNTGGEADNGVGIFAQNTGGGTGSVKIVTGAGLNVHVTGDAATGIEALSNSSGAVSITTGAGSITLDQVDDGSAVAGPPGRIVTTANGGMIVFDSVGILANSTGGGAVSINNAADVTVTAEQQLPFNELGSAGLYAASAGKVSITNTGTVVSNQGAGIIAAGTVSEVDVFNDGAVTGGDYNNNSFGQDINNTGAGIQASSTSGDVFVNGSGAVTVASGAGNGINAVSGSGDVTVGNIGAGYTGAIDPQGGGIGINATTSGNVFVKTGTGGAVSGGASIGINAVSTGGLASVTVIQGAAIGTVGDKVSGAGINAAINNALGTGAVSVTGDANIFADGDGIDATTNGVGGVSVNYGTNAGATIDAGPIGISATLTNAANPSNVTVTVGNGVSPVLISADQIGVLGSTAGTGDAVYASNGNVTIDPDDYGVRMFSAGGSAFITTGPGDVTIVNDAIVPGSDALNVGLSAETGSLLAGDVASVTIGANNTITVEDTADGEADGGIGVQAIATGGGAANVLVDTTGAAGLNLTVTGDNAVGVQAQILAGGSGNATVNTGAGQITVNNGVDDVDGAGNFGQSTGILATAVTGNVNVNNQASITVDNGTGLTTGILATTSVNGTIDVGSGNAASAIVTTNGDGIHAENFGGGFGTVTVGGGANGLVESDITTNGFGDGIEATTSGTGAILVTQGPSSTITINGAGRGIWAHNTGGALLFGDVTVASDGDIVTNGAGAGNEGILAETNGNGQVKVVQTANGSVTTLGANTDGIVARNTSGANGDVFIDVAGATNATGIGLWATSNTNDNVQVDTQATATISAGSFGILAELTAAQGQDVTVIHRGAITASGDDGIRAQSASNGDVGVQTLAGSTIESLGDGIQATANGGTVINASNVVVNHAGAIGSGAAVGGAGIDAQITNAVNGGVVQVTSSGTIAATLDGVHAESVGSGDVKVSVTGGAIVGGQDGVEAFSNGGGGDVTVTTAAGSSVTGVTGDGIFAHTTGGDGNVLVTTNGSVFGDPGIKATAVGNGTVTVNANGVVVGVNDGVYASTVNGTTTVNVGAAGDVTGGFGAGDGNGIEAFSTGTGAVLVNTTAGSQVTGSGTNTVNGNGIYAHTGTGNITLTLAGTVGTTTPNVSWGVRASSTGAGTVSVTNSGTVLDGGVLAETTGAANVTVTNSGSVTDTGGDGILVIGQSGVAQVNLNGAGSVNASLDGVAIFVTDGTVLFNGSAGSSITAGNDGIRADASAAGGTIDITSNGTITTTSGDGIDATTADGFIDVLTTGTITAGGRGVSAVAGGANLVQVTTGPGAITAAGAQGINAQSNGGNVIVNASGAVSGQQGINAGTNGAGFVNVHTTKSVVGTTGTGIVATGGTGGSTVTSDGPVTGAVGGIDATATGAGAVTVTANDAVNGNGGVGINADAATGNVSVTTLSTVAGTSGIVTNTGGAGTTTVTAGGTVTGTAGDGINSTTSGSGAISIVTKNVVASNDGVFASSTGGSNIQVITNGTVNAGNNGIETSTTGAGTTNIDANGQITVLGNGVNATTSGTGLITIETEGVTADGHAIFASSAGGDIVIHNNGALIGDNNLGTFGNGIDATAGGAGSVKITLGNTVFGSTGIDASATGSGNVDIIVGSPAYTVTGWFGDGINATVNTGTANIGTAALRILSNVSGAQDGIDASASGAGGTVNVYTGANVTAGSGWGITASTTTGPVTVDTLGGTITSSGAGGIRAVSTTGTVSVNNHDVIVATTGLPSIGIDAESAGGVVRVDSDKNIQAGKTGIFASNTTGSIAVGFNAFISGTFTGMNGAGSAGIQTVNGSGGTSVTTAANMAGLANADYGIRSSSTTGQIVITNTGAIGAAGGGNGVNVSGIEARSSGANTQGVTVVNSGNIFVDNGGFAGIDAENAGTGDVTVTNTGTIDPPLYGIFALGGGNVTVSTSGNVTGLTGIHTQSTSALNTKTATTNVTGTATVTGTAGNGIESSTAGANIVVNDTSTGSIFGQTNGVFTRVAGGSGATTVGTVGNVTGATGNGIDAATTGTGAVSVTSSGGTISAANTGIVAAGTSGAVSVSNSDTITTATIGGIDATSTSGAISISNSGSMTSLANADFGIRATSTTGGITISNTATGDIGSAGAGAGVDVFGITATSSGANVTGITIVNAGDIWVDTGGTAGINAVNAGTGTVSVTNSGNIDPAAFGIFAKSGGNVIVSNSGTILAGVGIHADSTGATSTVEVYVTGGGGVTGTSGDGIEASTTGTGQVNVGSAGNRIAAPVTGADDGISATGLGNVQVFTGNVAINGATAALGNWGIDATSTSGGSGPGGAVIVDTQGSVKGGQGIRASTTGTDAGDTVTVNAAGPVTGVVGDGIQARGVNGAVAVTSTALVTGATDGIDATTSGSGSVSVSASVQGTAVTGGDNGVVASSTGGGNIVVATTGNVSGGTATGITATTSGGNGTVSVVTSNQTAPAATNTVTGPLYGILASSTGTGSTSVTTNTIVTATAPGTLAVPSLVNGGTGPVAISATGGTGGGALGAANGVVVTVNNTVAAAGGRAIVTNSANNAAITIGAGVLVTGLGDEAGVGGATKTHAVIDVTTASGARTTITNGGTITSGSASPAAYGDLALLGTGGNVTLTNNGTVLGRVNTSGLTGTNQTTVNNAGIWHTTGTTTFSGGADQLNNTGQLLTASGGVTTTFDFGAGADVLNNAKGGTFVVGEATTAASTVNLAGLESLVNNGTIIFGSANNATSDNQINDRLLGTAATVLSGAGTLRMDADLWSTAQTNCATLTAADCLQVGSTAAGANQAIVINDTNAHALGAFNPNGIAIVTGSSNAAHFHLDPASEWFVLGGTPLYGGATNVLDKPGFFFYDLAFDAATNRELLISAPKAPAFEMAHLGGASSDIWHTTTQSWFDRQADLRDTISGRAAGGAPGVWLKVIGDWTRRSSVDTLTLFNKTYTFNTGYNQDTAALVGGVDFLNVTQQDKAWVLGVQGGYVDSNVRFKATPDRANLTGTTLGVYGTYVSGGLFIDGIVNANFLSLDVSFPGLQTTPSPWTASGDVRTWGGQLEAGYAMPIGASSFWEPVASLAYARTSLDDLLVPGGTQQFGDMDSFRGSLGARIGTTASYQYYKIKLALEGRVWDEWNGDIGTVLVVPGGPNFLDTDNIDGVFGEIKGEANLFAVGNNLSAFLNGGIKWKSHYQSTTVTLGVRYQW